MAVLGGYVYLCILPYLEFRREEMFIILTNILLIILKHRIRILLKQYLGH